MNHLEQPVSLARRRSAREQRTSGSSSGAPRTEMIDPVMDPRWIALLGESPSAVIFHTPAWLALLHAQYRYPVHAHCIVDGEGRILAALPFAHIRSRLTGSRLVATPFSDICPTVVTPDGQQHLDALIESIRARHARDGLDVEIRSPVADFGAPGSSFYHHVVPLGPDVDEVRRGLHSSVRRRVSRATRDGVTVVRATGPAALDAFYRLHLRTRRRQGVPTQPKRFIDRFRGLFDAGLGFVLLARASDRTIAAAVFLQFNGVLTYKYGASDRSHLKLKPNNAIFMEAIRWGCEHGCTGFDLGRTDLDNEGLRAFKRGWGAEERVLNYSRLSRRDASGGGGVPGVVGAIISHTPPVTGRLIGAAAYRHFG